MQIIIFAVLCGAVLIGIAAAAVALSSKVLKEPVVEDDTKQQENLSEWSKLARQHDPEKAREAMMSSSEAYQALAAIYSELEKSLPGSLTAKIKLKDPAALRDWTIEKDFWPGADASERKDYLAWSLARNGAFRTMRERIDLACAMGATAESQDEKDMCMSLAGKIYELLDTGIRVRLETLAEDGVHQLWREFRIEPDEIARMAGAEPGTEPADMLGRFRILKSAGFRCHLCGRSPISGGRLYVCKDAITGEDTCLCEGCADD